MLSIGIKNNFKCNILYMKQFFNENSFSMQVVFSMKIIFHANNFLVHENLYIYIYIYIYIHASNFSIQTIFQYKEFFNATNFPKKKKVNNFE